MDVVVRAEILVEDEGPDHLPVRHDASHGQAAHLVHAGDGLDDAQHGRVVGEGVHVHAQKLQAGGQLDAQLQAQAAQPAASLVGPDDDEGVGHGAAAGVFADGQDEGGHHLPVVLVDDGEAEAVSDLGAELGFVGVLVDAEALALAGGHADHGVGVGELFVRHGVHQEDLCLPLAVHAGGCEWGDGGGQFAVVGLVQHGGRFRGAVTELKSATREKRKLLLVYFK